MTDLALATLDPSAERPTASTERQAPEQVRDLRDTRSEPPAGRGGAVHRHVPVGEFARARIARICDETLRRAGVLGVLPTPLDAVAVTAGMRERIELPPVPAVGERRLLGALWFEQRALFVDARQNAPRRRFTEAHEIAHLLCPWHASALRLDTAAELFGELARGLEAEANFGAGELLFQGALFREEACEHDRSLRTPFALAARYGASRHAAAHRYVEESREPMALAIAGRWPTRAGDLPIWRSVESPSFRCRHGPLPAALPAAGLHTTSGPLAEAIDAARRSSGPVAAELRLADRRFHVDVANNRHCHLIFLAELQPRRGSGPRRA